MDAEGGEYPGTVPVEWLTTVDNPLAEHMHKQVPLSEADFQALLAVSTPNRRVNWQRFRDQGLI